MAVSFLTTLRNNTIRNSKESIVTHFEPPLRHSAVEKQKSRKTKSVKRPSKDLLKKANKVAGLSLSTRGGEEQAARRDS